MEAQFNTARTPAPGASRRDLSAAAFAAVCAAAVLGLIAMMLTPPGFAGGLLTGRMLSIHLVLELFSIMIAGLVVAVSWNEFGQRKGLVTNALLAGFTVVMAADLMHALTYQGMPELLTESSTPRAIFFWLMGRTFEVLALGGIALRLVPGVSRSAALAVGVCVAAGVVAFGSFALDRFPATFVEGQGVTGFKAGYEYVLCALNILLCIVLRRRAVREGQPHFTTLALSAFMMGVGGLAFTAYVTPSDFQNIFGHAYKVCAYALLYRATFITSMAAPYEALRESARQLRESEARLRTLGTNIPQSVLYQVVRSADGQMRFTQVSDAIERINGLRAASVLQDPTLWYSQVLEEDRPALQAAEARSAETMQLFDMEVRSRRADGAIRRMHLVSAPRRLEDGRLVWDGIQTDVTERRETEESRRLLEAQLREAQKMESIGTLASGIAHDFNNVLGAIVGNAAMARADCERGATPEVSHALDQILRASQRARDLVRQILTFGRRQPVERTVQPLYPLLVDCVSMLKATLPAGVEVVVQADDRSLQASVDRTQIGQVLMNLCTNAWQAMGEQGGRIEVGLQRAVLDAEPAIAAQLLPGPYVHIWVADNGGGMDEETQRRVFEPFFTTKAIGKGTGLGLAVVHGIVQGHEGRILLASSPGRGTRFDIYLPPVHGAAVDNDGVPADDEIDPNAQGRGERVLYLDDDDIVSMMVERLVSRANYRVTCCAEPHEAITVLQRDPQGFEVLVTDYNMPAMSGLEVIRRVRELNPEIAIVLTSGSVTDELRAMCDELGVGHVLDKQFVFEQLPSAIVRALQSRGAISSPTGGSGREAA